MELAERHLADCQNCRHELESLRRAHSLIAESRTETVPPPRATWSSLRSRLLETPQELPRGAARQSGKPDYSYGSAFRSISGKSRFTTNLPRIALAGSAAILVFSLGAQFGRPLRTQRVKQPSADLRVDHSALQARMPKDGNSEVAEIDLGQIKSVQDFTQRRLNPYLGPISVSNVWSSNDQGTEQASPQTSSVRTKNTLEATNRVTNGLNSASTRSMRIPHLHKQSPTAEKSSGTTPKKKIQFHPYIIQPGQEAPKTLLANTQPAADRVMAVGNESDPADGYVMETVRPVSSDDQTPY